MAAARTGSDNVREIDLGKLMIAYLRKWYVFLLVMVIFGGAAFVGSRILIAPTYDSTVQIYVNNGQITSDVDRLNYSDVQTGISLVNLYKALLNTEDTLDLIQKEAKLDYSYEALRGMLTTSSVNDTQIISIRVTSTDPEEAGKIAQTIGKVLPGVISEVIPSADARVVSHAKVPTQKSGPSNTKNGMMGAILGFLIVAVVITIRELMDTEIHNENDIADVAGDLPILVHLPDNGNRSKKSRGIRYYA